MRRIIVALGFLCLFAAPAGAQSFKERTEVCLACHGEKGQSDTPEVPSLGGMPSNYVLIQLYLFREKRRAQDIMNDQAKDMKDSDLQAFADFIAKLPPPKPPADTPDPERMARGQALVVKHHCNSCHMPDFSGREQMPRLADQREDYLLKALRDYKSAVRPGYDATMDEVIRPVSEADIVDLAHYLAHFR